MKKVIIIATLAILAISYIGVKFYAEKEAKKTIDAKIEKLDLSNNIQYKDIAVNPLTQRLSMLDVTATLGKQTYQMDELILYNYEVDDELPIRFHGGFKGLQINLDQNNPDLPQIVYYLKEYGYKNLKLDAFVNYHFDKQKKELCLRELSLKEEIVGVFQGNLCFANVTQPKRELSDFFSIIGYLEKISLLNAELIFDNLGLMDRIYTKKAKDHNISTEEYQQSLLAELDSGIAEEKNPYIKRISSELRTFLENSTGITIKTVFKKPFNLSEIIVLFLGDIFGKKQNTNWDQVFADYPLEVKAR